MLRRLRMYKEEPQDAWLAYGERFDKLQLLQQQQQQQQQKIILYI